MYDYIKGKIEEINPAELILECGGIGYSINISLQTYETLQGKDSAKIYVFHYIREDEESFYGFATKDERELFKLLISVNGVGVGSARMMLSSLSDEEIRNAIIGENVARIKSVKGIGLKTAQRIILDLKDKIVKGGGTAATLPTMTTNNANIEEATIALTMLGFSKVNINKVIPDIIKKNSDAKVEDIIKEALKKL
ncbi:MAG: Holliday junction branch migration protein RuvA [Bacteroidales bacterium]|nr:Holliday junction branch migration protein RuvA [Bacteroidales bacterium]